MTAGFDLAKARNADCRFRKCVSKYPAPEVCGEVAISVWGYRAALDEIERLQKEKTEYELPRA